MGLMLLIRNRGVKSGSQCAAFCCGLYWMAQSMTRPVIGLYAKSGGASETQIGLILAIYAFLPMVLAIPSGGMANTLGKVKLLRIGSVLMVGSGGCYLIGKNFFWILLAQLIAGVGQMFVWLSVQALATEEKNWEKRENGIASFSLLMSMGQLLGPFLGGTLSDWLGYVGVFCGYLILSLLLTGLSWCCEEETEAHVSYTKQSIRGIYRQVLVLLGHKGFSATLLCTFIALFIIDVRTSFLPLYLAEMDISHTLIGFLISFGAFSAFFVKPVYPRLIRRMGYIKLQTVTLGISLSLLLITPFLKSVVAFAVLLFVSGLALGVNQPLSLSLVAEQTNPEERGVGVGLRVMANRAAQLIDPLLFSSLSVYVGLRISFWIIGALLFIVSVLSLWLFAKSTSVPHVSTNYGHATHLKS